MTDTARILAHMDANPGTSARQAADALGLDARAARIAKRERRAHAPARGESELVTLAPDPPARNVATETPVEFWTAEVHEIYRRRADAQGIAYNNCTRDLHNARRELEAAIAALPRRPVAETDAELIEDLAEALGVDHAAALRMVEG